jgi:hypothetical protein
MVDLGHRACGLRGDRLLERLDALVGDRRLRFGDDAPLFRGRGLLALELA